MLDFTMTSAPTRRFAALTIRTSHDDAPSDIPAFWGRAMAAGSLHGVPGAASQEIHALYFEMEGDWRGAYTMGLAVELDPGAPAPEGLELVEVPARSVARAALPDGSPASVGAAWHHVWHAWPEREARAYNFEIESHGSNGVIFELSVTPASIAPESR